MLPFTIEKGDCTGCSACYAICPVHCIEMKSDEEGFLYPVASDQCINCNKCQKICPRQNPNFNETIKQKAFAACSKNHEIWKRSSSGGAFSEICYSFGDSNTLFVGAAWNNLSVQHIGVGIKNLKVLCKSKYVASDLGDTFNQIKEHLLQNQKVIFCGTPCQVAGLRNFLGKDYEKLLLIDLICHGVGSPKVFQTCIENLEKQFSKRIAAYEFRSKRSIYEGDHLQKVTFIDNSEVYLKDDPYIQLFLKQQCLRPSCGKNCKYRDEHRQGDITIADFKGLAYVFPELAGSKVNFSSIIANTNKGEKIVSALTDKMNLYPCDIGEIKKYNPLFYKQTIFPEERDLFFNDFNFCPEAAIKKYTTVCNIKYKKKFTKKVYDLLPTKIRQKIWQLLHK